MAEAYKSYALKLASAPILTGPGIVDKDNIEVTLKGGAQGYR
jgi:simple sugar transport system substrate-binding protein